MNTSPIVAANQLAKDYGAGFGLAPTDLVVERGELVLLIGHNGSGKSTLLGLLGGFLEPTNGTLTVLGDTADSITARAGRSYVPDEPILYTDLTLWEHIAYNAALHQTPKWEDRAADLLERFDIAKRVDDLPARFSRGMKQKAAIIISLTRPFDLLLVDEPFLGLDIAGQDALVDIIGSLAEQGTGVIVSTHQPNITETASRCVGLRDGELVYDGEPDPETISRIIHG